MSAPEELKNTHHVHKIQCNIRDIPKDIDNIVLFTSGTVIKPTKEAKSELLFSFKFIREIGMDKNKNYKKLSDYSDPDNFNKKVIEHVKSGKLGSFIEIPTKINTNNKNYKYPEFTEHYFVKKNGKEIIKKGTIILFKNIKKLKRDATKLHKQTETFCNDNYNFLNIENIIIIGFFIFVLYLLYKRKYKNDKQYNI